MWNFLAGLVQALAGWMTGRRDTAQRQAGRQEQVVADQQAAIEAQRRMDDAAARPRGPTEDTLDKGAF